MILALTSANANTNNVNYNLSSRDLSNGRSLITPPADIAREFRQLGQAIENFFSPTNLNTIIGIIVGLVCLALLLGVLFRIANYVSKVALIRMVDDYEATGEKVPWRQGFRLGWSRSAWNLFLIDLVVYLPLVLVVIALFGCAALPLVGSYLSGNEPGAVNFVAMIGSVFLIIFLLLIITLLLSLVMELIRRECVLHEIGAIESIRRGVQLLRCQFKDVFLMWLILLGVNIVFIIAMIPVILVLLGIGALSGGGVGLLVYNMMSLPSSQVTAILTAVGVGLAIFFVILVIPLTFIGGLRETYISTTWTLTYRELSTLSLSPLEQLDKTEPPAELPSPEPSPAE
jgi:hypothetical protein